jgi:hypothetical protein
MENHLFELRTGTVDYTGAASSGSALSEPVRQIQQLPQLAEKWA